MGIADIFEALTAKDRPYKKGKTLSESLEILGRMKENHHVDPDLFDIFVRRKVYQRYAEMFLDKEQIDEVDESRIPGYRPSAG
jgi:HD-GYP domain-containing protein (c-di-GMP phosphodiesterase class II)